MNKLSPMVSSHVLARHRLFPLFDQPFPTNVYWISGPAGSGKTTLIASLVKRIGNPGVWYQIDTLDNDPATFFFYFGKAVVPILKPGDSTIPLFNPQFFPDIEIFASKYFEKIFQCFPSGSWLVFDNFQASLYDVFLVKVILTAVEQLPTGIKIFIISREDPPAQTARLLVNRRMKRIGWSELAFTVDELHDFLKLSKRKTTRETVEKLHHMTHGWIAGAVLWLLHPFAQHTQYTYPTDHTPQYVFDYFMTEVLEKLESEVKEFLLRTAILPFMTVDMAVELTGMPAEGVLQILSRQNFFCEKKSSLPPCYVYHQLFRTFLMHQAELGYCVSTMTVLRYRAAVLLERHGFLEEAIDAYGRTGTFVAMKRLIHAKAREIISQGRHAVLASWIDDLPPNERQADPWLLYWLGIARVPSNPEESKALFFKAFEGNRRINPICANGKIDVPLSRKKGGVYGTCYRKRTGQETNQLAEAY